MSVGMAFGTDTWRTLRSEVKVSVSLVGHRAGVGIGVYCRDSHLAHPDRAYNALINLRHAR